MMTSNILKRNNPLMKPKELCQSSSLKRIRNVSENNIRKNKTNNLISFFGIIVPLFILSSFYGMIPKGQEYIFIQETSEPSELRALDLFIRQQNCPPEIDGLSFVTRRMDRRVQGVPQPWQQTSLNDKWGFYIFAKNFGFNIPEIYYASNHGPSSLLEWEPPKSLKGFVVKVKNGWEARGVYLLENGFEGREILSGKNMTKQDIIDDLRRVIKSKEEIVPMLHIEELLVGNEEQRIIDGRPVKVPPIDYKFFVADGLIESVAIVANRGTSQLCVAMVDENFERLDANGCFSNRKKYFIANSTSPQEKNISCPVTRYKEDGMIFNFQKRCSDMVPPGEWHILVDVAKRASNIIGIYFRLDLYLYRGRVYLGEATFLPTFGKHHCVSKLDDKGCADPCVKGRFWKRGNDAHNNIEGGPITDEPDCIKGWKDMTSQKQTELVMETSLTFP